MNRQNITQKNQTETNSANTQTEVQGEISLMANLIKNTCIVNVLRRRTSALIDSGASINAISREFLEKTGQENLRIDITKSMSISVANSARMSSLGTVTLPVKFTGFSIDTKFHVFDNLHHTIILGTPFLTDNKCELNLSKNQLEIFDNTVKHGICVMQKQGFARARQMTTIPPRTTTVVPVKCGKREREVVLLEPMKSIEKLHLMAARCMVKTAKRKSYLQVTNPTDKEITIPYQYILASVSDIETSNIQKLEQSKTEHSINNMSNSNEQQNIDYSKLTSDLKIDLTNSDLTHDQKLDLAKFIVLNRDVFATSMKELGCSNAYEHIIDLIPGSAPVRTPFYRASAKTNQEITRQIKELKENDLIEESNSEYFSPVCLVPKKSGEYRFCVDYRKLNKITKRLSWPLI